MKSYNIFSLFSINLLMQISQDYKSKIKSFSFNARLFLVSIFLISLSIGIYEVIFNLYILKLGFKEDFLGFILSLVSISTGLFSIPASIICDKIGRKNTLVLSSFLLLVSFIFLFTTTSQIVLSISSVLYGISTALKVVTSSTFMIENSSASERMHLFSMYHLFYTVAVMVGNFVGGFFPGFIINQININPTGAEAYRLSLYISLFAVLISLVPLIFIKEKKLTIKHEKLFSNLISALNMKIIQQLMIINALIGIGWGLALPYFNVYFDIVFNATAAQIGIIFSISQIARSLFLVPIPILTEKFGKIKVIAITQLFSIPMILLFVFTPSLTFAAVGYIMRTAIMNMSNPVISNFNMEIVEPEHRATVNSLTWMSCYTFVGISTYVSGLIMAKGYYKSPFLITCVVYIIASVLYYVFFEKVEKSHNSVA